MSDIEHNRRGSLSPAQAGAMRALGLAIGPVVAVDGWVVWGSTGARNDLLLGRSVGLVPEHGWVPVRADGRWLVRQISVLLLPPGPYRFHLCGDTMVSAESRPDPGAWWSMSQGGYGHGGAYYAGSLPAPLPIGDPAALFRVVSEALRFDEDDLAHNRRGALSPRQGGGPAARIEGVIESCCQHDVGVIGPLVASLVTPGGRAVPMPRDPPGFTGRLRTWWLVGDRAIWVPSSAYWAVPSGLAYRVYLDPRSERVVSVEPAPSARTAPPG